MAPMSKPGVASNDTLQWHELKYNGLTLKYTLGFWGAQPDEGYPLYIGLHGGGGYDAGDFSENDANWVNFAKYFYYLPLQAFVGPDNTKPGSAYIACRGVSSFDGNGQLKDEYNIHSRPECYVLYQQMISNLIQKSPYELQANFTDYKGTLNPRALHFVDSNRVHLMGFSAGGDGAFNLARCLPDLFASVVPSAGYASDNNGSQAFFENFANLPTCLQVGEKDDAYFPKDQYDRSERAKFYYNYHKAIDQLRIASQRPNLYYHDMFMVKDGIHDSWFSNSWQNPDTNYDCLSNLDLWYNNFTDPQARVTSPADLNAVLWSSSRTRQRLPQNVIWNLGQRPDPPVLQGNTIWESKRFFYWLFDRKPSKTVGLTNTIRAFYSSDNGKCSIYVDNITDYMGILVRENMIGPNNEVTIVCSRLNFAKTVRVIDSMQIRRETYEARGDTYLTFSAMIYFEPIGNRWDVRVGDSLATGGGEPLKGKLVPDVITPDNRRTKITPRARL